MSLMAIDLIMERIQIASAESPIAVFKPSLIFGSLDKRLNAFFGDSVEGRMRIKVDKNLIGVFDNTMDTRLVLSKLMR